ncbi:B12-binding domain-containing radical SAM protein [Candidatus Formimonas warabiya]|uniref:B12-binding domain-containing radical SAM protein n=1 Tax=Formimonas warabiya TaxID=1761012 RepID=A0A3G1KRG9_FORW1|nr:cobalamin-dependent protein [Candidatus Formimonas warabiya]ATW25037.1 B12-binding domain-containing radical SAM protein [Candidatus Formimonas warabiya]
MKILLIRPRPHRDTIGLQSIMVCEPLELEYLAAAVRDSHQVDLVDMILEKKPLQFFIQKYRPQVVGLTAYISHIGVVKDYARIIKDTDPHIRVIVGGVHADVVPEDFLDPHIDWILSGGGAAAFRRLMDQGAENTPALGEEKIIKGDAEIPAFFPDRRITAPYRHRYYYIYHRPCALLKTSYGCPFSCTFCFCRQITRGNYFTRDLDGVIEEVKEIAEPEIYIVDDNFLVDRDRVNRFCDLLEQHQIQKRFLIYGRADFIAGNEKLMARFAQLGLRAVIVGVESPNPEELKQYDKKSGVEVHERAIKVLAQYGIDCYATLILGLDWDDRDFRRLYQWLKKQRLRFINLQPLTPLPGTDLYAQYRDQWLVPRARCEQWDLANLVLKPSRISPRRYYFNILKVYFLITLNGGAVGQNLKYGFYPNLKLFPGVLRITWQYVKKIMRG